MRKNTHPTRVQKDTCRRTLPARCGLFSAAPRSLRLGFQCSTHKGGLSQPGLQKLRELPAAAMTCASPAAGQQSQSGSKPGKTLQQSPPHFAQAQSSGACGPPARPMRSVSSSKVACVCLPCLLEGYVGHQRAGCGARTGPVFRPGCNDKVSHLATR